MRQRTNMAALVPILTLSFAAPAGGRAGRLVGPPGGGGGGGGGGPPIPGGGGGGGGGGGAGIVSVEDDLAVNVEIKGQSEAAHAPCMLAEQYRDGR